MPVKREDRERSKEKSIEASLGELNQLDLPGMDLMSLLQFGSGLLLKNAIMGEINEYLGRPKYEIGRAHV